MTTCATPIAGPALLDYWLEGADAERVEEHLLACAACSDALRALVPVARALEDMRASVPAPIVSRPQVDELRARGVRVTEHRVASGGELAWTIDDAELFVLAVPVDLAGVEHVDLEYCTPDGEVMTIFPDAPLAADATEVLIACERHIAVAHDRIRFRLRGRGAAGPRLLADCQVRAVRA